MFQKEQKKESEYIMLTNRFKDSKISFYVIVNQLPRIGTSIKAEVNLNLIKSILYDEPNYDMDFKDECRSFIDNIKYNRFDLVWDRVKSKFVVGNLKKTEIAGE